MAGASKNLVDKNKEKMKNLLTFALRYFIDKSYFGDDSSQNYLIFPPVLSIFKRLVVRLVNV